MQRIFLAIWLCAASAGGATAAEALPEKGALACSLEGDIGLVGWRPGTEPGTVEMLGAMAGETAIRADDALVVTREGMTIVLRADRAEFIGGGETRTGKCALVTQELLEVAGALG